MNLGEDIKKVATATEHAILEPFKFIARAESVLESAIKDQPEIKTVVIELVKRCESIGSEAMRDIGERGLNLDDDLDTARKIADLGRYLVSDFIPLVEKVYGEIHADLSMPQTAD